jgi:Icc-related predicted phosphoesterase
VSLFKRTRRPSSSTARVFFATDVHGSDVCFRKFVNARRFYDVQYLILGGDITGKAIVPIERRPGGWTVSFLDDTFTELTESGVAEVERRIRDAGLYPMRGERDELLMLEDEDHRERVFKGLIVRRVHDWVALAEDRLRGTGARCFITPGNDDFFEIDEALRGSDVVEFVEGRCVRLDEYHEMITTGYSNITPWNSPRELDEDALGERIEAMYADVTDPGNLVAVLHPPPVGTALDQAPAIDDEFRVKFEAGGVLMIGVGSIAVRRFVEERQPLIALHGHVHESQGVEQLGRTICLNPGSEYNDGTLSGAIVRIEPGRVASHQFVVG